MKKMLILAMLCCCVAMLWAISPVKTTCQFEVRNNQGELVTSGNVNVKLSVMKGSQTGETVYVETHSCTANSAGRVAVTLGEGGGSPAWSSLLWSNQTYFMKAEIQQGSSDYKEAGVLALTLSEEEDANVPINRFGSRVFLSNVALSGDYWDLTNKPVIPSSVSELSDAADYVTFDSLQRRFEEVEDQLDRLQDTLNNLRAALDTIRTSTSTQDASLTLNTNPSDSSVSLCGDEKYTVIYTAVLVGEEADTYEWSASEVEGVANGNTYTIEYTAAGTNTVTCTAAGMTKSKQMTIVNGGEAIIAICEKCDVNEVVIKLESNCTSYNWYNADDELVSNSSTGLTLSASTPVGVYRVVGSIASGCSTTRVVSLGKNTVHPCTVGNGLRAGTLLPNGMYANKEYGEGNRLDSVSDHEGNVYRVVDMNGKCWLAENMRATTSPSTGSTILLTTKYNSYCNKVACWYKHNQSSYGKYGILYNWCAAVDTFDVGAGFSEIATENSTNTWEPTFVYPRRGICPEGWHVPNDSEFSDFKAGFIKSSKGAGRVAGGCDWKGTSTDTKPNNYAYPERNITGFSILPTGYFYDGGFSNDGARTSFWSSTSYTPMHSIYYGLSNSSENFTVNSTNKTTGYSVRCMRNY